MKSPLRFSRASGSTVRRVEELIRAGWYPGCRISLLKSKRRARRQEAASHAF